MFLVTVISSLSLFFTSTIAFASSNSDVNQESREIALEAYDIESNNLSVCKAAGAPCSIYFSSECCSGICAIRRFPPSTITYYCYGSGED